MPIKSQEKGFKVKTWDDIWKDYEPNFLACRLHRAQAKTLAEIVNKIRLPKDSGIIDIGSGSGSTLAVFRNLGYSSAIGIDTSPHSLEICSQLFGFKEGKDTFLMNARSVEFPDNSFDLVFSDGLLEHFEEPPMEMAGELCRVSKKWILLFQPNQSSLFGKVKWLWQKAGRASWEREYHYSKSDYINVLAKFWVSLADSGDFNLHEFMWLLFSKERLEP